MPNRLLREGILTSERVNALCTDAELFYRRVMSVADDFGRFPANPQLLRAACYPLRLDTVTDGDILGWLDACEQAGLMVLYRVDGKAFLQLANFKQQLRTKKSKYAAPEIPPPEARVLESAPTPRACDTEGPPTNADGGQGADEAPGDAAPHPAGAVPPSRIGGTDAPPMRGTCHAEAKQTPHPCAASAHLDGDGDGDGSGSGSGSGKKAKAPSARQRAVTDTPFTVPVWLDAAAWQAFVVMRRRIRAPLTAEGMRLIVAKLARWREEGQDPVAVLERSVECSWRGVFPLPVTAPVPRAEAGVTSMAAHVHRMI